MGKYTAKKHETIQGKPREFFFTRGVRTLCWAYIVTVLFILYRQTVQNIVSISWNILSLDRQAIQNAGPRDGSAWLSGEEVPSDVYLVLLHHRQEWHRVDLWHLHMWVDDIDIRHLHMWIDVCDIDIWHLPMWVRKKSLFSTQISVLINFNENVSTHLHYQWRQMYRWKNNLKTLISTSC